MDISTEEVKIPKEKPSEIVCTFCMKPTCQDFANIQQKSDLLDLLKKLNVDILPINDQIDWICYQCTYKLNCIRDYARTWASCVTKNRINYYYRLGEKEMVRRLLNIKNSKPSRSQSDGGANNALNSSHNQNEFKLKIASVRSIDANDIPKTLTLPTINNSNNNNEQLQYDENDNGYNRGTPEQELLSVMYEKSEPVLNTESGHIYYRHKKNNTPTLLTCKKCHRVYKKLSFLKKHERKHERDDILKSNIQIPNPNPKTTTIKCKDCELSFISLTTWRKHYQIHQSRLKCLHCPAEFILLADLEMHEAICFGLLCADNKNEQSHRYMTRSAHRTNYTDNNSDDGGYTGSDIDTMYTKRLDNARDWVDKTSINNGILNDEKSVEQLNDDCESLATTFTRASSRLNDTTSYTEGEEDYNDDLSTLTRPSAASKKTIDRLKKRNKETDLLYENSRKRFKICKNALENAGGLIKCPDKNCNFRTTSIERLLEHDLTVHDELPLFWCKKCSGSFLRPIYVRHHLCLQNPGRFVCTQCELIFKFESELKRHLIHHDILDNTKKFCLICELNFADSQDYHSHLKTLKHMQNSLNIKEEKIKPEKIEYDVKGEAEQENDRKIYKKEKEEIEEQKMLVNKQEIEEPVADERDEKKTDFKDLFKDEQKNIAYEEIMQNIIETETKEFNQTDTKKFNETDTKEFTEIETKDVSDTKRVPKCSNENDSDTLSTIVIKTEDLDDDINDYDTVSLFKFRTDNKESIKLNRVQPYKSEIKIRRFDKPFRRRHDVVFRRWRPHMEPLRIHGTDYYDCSIRPYINKK